MKRRELLKILRAHDCTVDTKGGKGSHFKVTCGKCWTIVPTSRGDISPGALASIKRVLTPCLGKGWMKNSK